MTDHHPLALRQRGTALLLARIMAQRGVLYDALDRARQLRDDDRLLRFSRDDQENRAPLGDNDAGGSGKPSGRFRLPKLFSNFSSSTSLLLSDLALHLSRETLLSGSFEKTSTGVVQSHIHSLLSIIAGRPSFLVESEMADERFVVAAARALIAQCYGRRSCLVAPVSFCWQVWSTED